MARRPAKRPLMIRPARGQPPSERGGRLGDQREELARSAISSRVGPPSDWFSTQSSAIWKHLVSERPPIAA